MGQYSLWCHLVKLMKDVLFDFQIFHNGLQHEVRPLSCRSRVCGRRHIPQDLLDEFFTCLKMQHPSIVPHISLAAFTFEYLSGGLLILTSGLSANFFFTTLFRLPSIPLTAVLRMSSLVSTSVTECPVAAATFATQNRHGLKVDSDALWRSSITTGTCIINISHIGH